MCNLSQGIETNGYNKGYDKGYDSAYRLMIVSMYDEGYTFEQISKVAKTSTEEVEKIIRQHQPVMA